MDVFAAATDRNPETVEPLDLGQARLAIVVGSNAATRLAAARAIARTWAVRYANATVIPAPPAASWPFRHPLTSPLPEGPAIVWAEDVHEAVVTAQTGSTRLVTTQASYLFNEWATAHAGRGDVLLLAGADRDALEKFAPEVLARRGPFREAYVHVVDASSLARRHARGALSESKDAREDREGASADTSLPRAPEGTEAAPDELDEPTSRLVEAFRSADPGARLKRCVAAVDMGRTAPALLATASTCMEVNDLEAAERDLDEALARAPEWAAVHFERGKLWLRMDDMARAGASFREAAERMPSFGSAWANLGATLGELDRPEEALAAFQRALTVDPESHQALNNIGVVSRELGRLSESAAAFRRVIGLVPDLAFGHYNLGHTLFLQGRYHAALSAYTEGQRRDPEQNAVQATRLAVCRLATGDAEGALSDLQRATAGLPREYRRQLLGDTSTILWALLTHKPDLPGWKLVNDWLTGDTGHQG